VTPSKEPEKLGHRTRELYPASDIDGHEGTVMSWLVLLLSGVLEALWAISLGKSEGFSRPTPTATFFVALVLSMAGLAYAMLSGDESFSVVKVLLLVGIVGCVIGLKVLH